MENFDEMRQEGKDNSVKQRKLKGFVIGGAAASFVLVVAFVVLLGAGSLLPTKLESAVESCSLERNLYLTLDNDGRGLYLDGDGDENPGMNNSEIVCVLTQLEVPNSILSRMSNTTALMGQQSGSWGGMTVLWSYHPSNGLNISLAID